MKYDKIPGRTDGLRYDFDHRHPWRRPLSRELSRAMRKPVSKHMRDLEREWPDFASTTMDFILDVIDSPSLWVGYEAWNTRHFGVPLPITEGDPGIGLSPARLHHFVWKLLNIYGYDFSLPPDHPDVRTLVDVIGAFWEKRKDTFTPLSDSSAFLAGPIEHGWQAKDRLVVLGQTSYFFRLFFEDYIAPYAYSDMVIDHIDDFLCQTCSPWSGMGPIDLLAEVLDISDARRDDIRSWSQRHAAPYRVKSMKKREMLVTNLVTDEPYHVDWDEVAAPIPVGTIVFGFLARWNNSWRWSGVQRILGEGKSGLARVKDFIQEMRKSANQALCRYWPEYRSQVMEYMADSHKVGLEHYGGRDLVYFDNGEALAASMSGLLNDQRDKRLQAMKEPLPDIPSDFTPKTVLPEEIRECDNGVALYLNPDEGQEMMLEYDALVAALRKKGEGLTDEEREALREFIQSSALSPAFVRRVLREEPDLSLKIEFGTGDEAPAYWLDWLLRCWKGEFYRIRYPSVSIV